MYNSPYAFSESHVTTHIELEGLEKFSIHGGNNKPQVIYGPFVNRRALQAYYDTYKTTTNKGIQYTGDFGRTASSPRIIQNFIS